MKSRFALIFTVYILLSLPMVSAVPSGLTYLDSTWSSNDGEDGELIAINSNEKWTNWQEVYHGGWLFPITKRIFS